MICSTLTGKLAIKHPELPILVREDGYLLNREKATCKGVARYSWTPGCLSKGNNRGYYVIRVLGTLYQVHRLVCEVFHSNPENKPTVDHINRVRTDNRACNLRWATRHEQNENSSIVLNRHDYGVRWSENLPQYKKNWVNANREHCREYQREYMRKRRAKKKEEQRKATLPED